MKFIVFLAVVLVLIGQIMHEHNSAAELLHFTPASPTNTPAPVASQPSEVAAPAAPALISAGDSQWCELSYRPVDPATPDQPRPQMPFTIEYGPRAFSGVALVDSGADGLLFPLSYAHALGIDLANASSGLSQGVGGTVATYRTTITLRVSLCGHEFHYAADARFSDGMESEGIGLLGQTGFLDHFQVVFRKAEEKFAIRLPAATSPPATVAAAPPAMADPKPSPFSERQNRCAVLGQGIGNWRQEIEGGPVTVLQAAHLNLETGLCYVKVTFRSVSAPADYVVRMYDGESRTVLAVYSITRGQEFGIIYPTKTGDVYTGHEAYLKAGAYINARMGGS
jgi:hypothetical protein